MKKYRNQLAVGVLSASMLFGCVGTMQTKAATEHWNDASGESASWTAYKANWDVLSKNYENVSLTPGADQSKLNLAWYSHTNETPKVRIGTDKDAMDKAKEYTGKQVAITLTGLTDYYSNKVTVDDIKENTTYYYQVFQNGAWQDAKIYQTKSFDSYSFLYVGDPQIGACTKQTSTENEKMSESNANLAARNDSYNWERTLANAMQNHPEASFMVSAGDQVNTADKEEEYAGYLGASALRSLPVATTIGNHDSKSSQYTLHYNNPNSFDTSDTKQEAYTKGATKAGSDYYYTYGDVLFIVLDTNNYNCSTHENVMKKAVAENPNAKWRIVTFHQDIYGSGLDHSDSDGIVLRTQLTPLMDKYDIDVVLQGHDHTYSRTYQLTSDGAEHTGFGTGAAFTYKAPSKPAESNYQTTEEYQKALQDYNDKLAQYQTFAKENNCYNIKSNTVAGTVVNPEGSVYFEANSATGSKFYNLIASQQDYIAERSQTWSPSYSVVNVSETALSVATYDAKTGAPMEGSSTYTIVKEADKTALKADVKTAKEKDTAGYTKASVDQYNAAIQKAEECAGNVNAKKKEVEQAASALSKATAELSALRTQEMTVPASLTGTVGDRKELKAVNKGTGAISYQSDNEDVAMVSKKGIVRLVGAGKANITVTAAKTEEEQQATKTVAVTVSEKTTQAPNITKPAATTTAQPAATASATTATQPAATTQAPKTVTKAKQQKLKKVSGLKVKQNKKSAKISYRKVNYAEGYEICYAATKDLNKNATIVKVSSKETKKTIRKLTKGTYYVAVRAYKKTDGQTLYGAYSKVQKMIVK